MTIKLNRFLIGFDNIAVPIDGGVSARKMIRVDVLPNATSAFEAVMQNA